MKINRLIRIVSTNWIHLIGFYIATYLSLIIFKVTGIETSYSWGEVLLTSILTIPLLFITYGAMIIGGFYCALVIIDVFAFSSLSSLRREILIVEWAIISMPFVIWAFEYKYWLWISLTVSFFVTQMIRLRKIAEIEKKPRLL